MGCQTRKRRDFEELERRRKQAARLFRKGAENLAAIARQLKASRQSVCRWYRDWKRGGMRGLAAAGRAGRRPRLDKRQMRNIEVALRKGPQAHGFPTELWTLPRVTVVIERVTGVSFHPGHVWKILGTMNWTVQKPATQARERDEGRVAYWKAVRWPALKKTLQSDKAGSSSKTSRGLRSNRQ